MSVKQLAKKVLTRLANYETAKAGVKEKKAALLVKEAHRLDSQSYELRTAAVKLNGEAKELRSSASTINGLAEKLQ